jgi:hypothetical protein
MGMNDSKSGPHADETNAEAAHAALLERLDQVCRKPVKVRAPQSLQPTPEASKSRAARLRKKRLYVQRSRRSLDTKESSAPAS